MTIIPWIEPDKVCLIRNYRVAAGKALVELPAGTLEPGESHAETAHRELIEETGYRAARVTLLAEFYMSPGILDERMYLYLAEELTAVGPHREPGEEIENLELPWQQALSLVDTGQIEDAKTIAGLLYYERRRELRVES